jgi:diphthamide biosynthesis protein 3
MIPPIGPSVLASNPQFASLHKHLTSNLLDLDASTHATNESHTSVSRALLPHLLRATREELLRSSLRNIAALSEERRDEDVLKLPPELKELVGTISMLLDEAPSMNLNEDDYDLLGPDIDAFHDMLNEVAGAVAADLERLHDLLCKISSASTSPPRDPSSARCAANSKRSLHKLSTNTSSSLLPNSLPTLLHPLLPSVPNPALQSSLTTASDTTLQHASAHRTLLSTTVTHLERTTHGLYARHTKARSAHLSAIATALAKRIEVAYLQSRNRIYRTDVQRALGNYSRHLETVGRELEERERTLRGVLEEYDDVGVDGIGTGKEQRGPMREVGRRYGKVLWEIEAVKAEIAKLESGTSGEKESEFGGVRGKGRAGES